MWHAPESQTPAPTRKERAGGQRELPCCASSVGTLSHLPFGKRWGPFGKSSSQKVARGQLFSFPRIAVSGFMYFFFSIFENCDKINVT